MSKWIPLLALALLASAGVFFLTTRSKEHLSGIEHHGELGGGIEPETNGQSALIRRPEGRSSSEGGASPGPELVSSGERGSLGPQLTTAKGGGEFVVIAIDPRLKLPVEGMRVLLANRDGVGLVEWQALASDPRAFREWMQQHGRESTTDQEGKAYFERVLTGAILAEGNGWSAVADWIGPVESPYELRLTPKTELRVRVLDREGVAKGEVPVFIGPMTDDRWLPMLQRGTNTSGVASFDGVERLAQRAQKEKELGVYLGFPHYPRMHQVLDPTRLPEGEIELTLPDCAPLSITVHDGAGKPLATPFKVEVGLPSPTEGAPFTPILSRRAANGVVEFPYVGCGVALLVRLSGIPELQDQIFELRGPERNGVLVHRTIQWYLQRTIFVGTARYGSKVLAQRTLRATWSDGRDSRSLPVITGANGDFRIVTTGPECRSLYLEILPVQDGIPYTANPPLPLRLPGGEYSLDPIQWETLPLFLEGRVVDLAGMPVPGVLVRLETEQRGSQSSDAGKPSDRDGDKSSGGRGPAAGSGLGASRDGARENARDKERSGKEGEGRGGREDSGTHWAPIPRMTALTDDAGNFQIYGKAYGTRYRLQATRRGFSPGILGDVSSNGGLWIVTLDGNLAEINAREQAQETSREEFDAVKDRR